MKKPIFKSKSIPGLSKEYLNTLTDRHYISKQGGETTKNLGVLSDHGKLGAKSNLESGQIHNKFIPAGNAKVQEMIKSGEWKEISSRGWEGIKDKDAAKAKMKETAKLAQTPESKAKMQATKSKNRVIRELEFYNQLNEVHTTKESDQIALSMGFSTRWGRRIIIKLGTKISFDGRVSTYKKQD
tara:strand:+ start:61 stop:612 length:552 start_codon:yes stop_codon:yes gene_type:complete